jgi:hypothetical protein
MRALAIAAVLCAVASADAAPSSFELPAGYTEQPGAGEARVEELRKQERTLSIDAQIYLSPDERVELMRQTVRAKLDGPPTRSDLVSLDRGVVKGATEDAARLISDSRRWLGDQLDATSIHEVDDIRIVSRKLYSADTMDVVHMFTVVCAGPADQLGDCERAQQTMQLTLPNQASLRDAALPSRKSRTRSLAYDVGRIAGSVVLLALLIWLLRKPRR